MPLNSLFLLILSCWGGQTRWLEIWGDILDLFFSVFSFLLHISLSLMREFSKCISLIKRICLFSQIELKITLHFIYPIHTETPILWPPDAKNWLILKDPDAGKDGRQEEKGTTEDEMVGWHHQLNGHGFE